MPNDSRTCARCGTTPDVTVFAKERRAPDGLASYCRPCSRKRKREQYAQHAEAHNARTGAYYRANRDDILAQQAQYRAENADRILAYEDERSGRPERVEQRRERYLRNRDQTQAEVRDWFRAHPSHSNKWRAQQRLIAHGFPEVAAAAELVDLDEMHERHDGRCGICGNPVARFDMTVDHIKPVSLGGPHNEANCQPAHLRCNQAKGRQDHSCASLTSSAEAS